MPRMPPTPRRPPRPLRPRRPLRLTPPDLPDDPALQWTLARAFGPSDPKAADDARDPAGGVDGFRTFGASAARIALALDLGARIAARVERETLVAELGESAAEELCRRRRDVAAQGLRLGALARDVAALAERHGLRIAWLKYAALGASGVEVVGRRAASDLDLLAPAADARELQRRLVAEGFAADASRPLEHHLPALAHAERGALELHLVLPGLRLEGGRRSADFAALERHDLLRSLGGAESTLERPALVAHLLAHGAAQHALAPRGYPLARLIADLVDLGAGPEELERSPISVWVGAEAAETDLRALLELARGLGRGDRPSSFAGARSGLWLAHCVACALEPDYERSLRWRAALRVPSDRATWLRPWLGVWRALAPGPAATVAIYGPSSVGGASRGSGVLEVSGASGASGARLGRRLLRPFDLARRAWSGWQADRRLRRLRRLRPPRPRT